MQAYVYQASLLCGSCGAARRAQLTAPADVYNESSYDSDDYPKGPYPDGGGEADSPQHCDDCGVFLENPLTSNGVECVVSACVNKIDNRDTSVAWQEWAPFYGVKIVVQCGDTSEEA